MTSPYREPGDRDDYEEPMRLMKLFPIPKLAWRLPLLLQGPIVAGHMHDVAKPGHSGVCWGIAIAAISVAVVVGVRWLDNVLTGRE